MSTEYTCSSCKSQCNGCNGCNSCNTVIGLCSTIGQKASDHLNNFNWTDSNKGTSRGTLQTDDLFFTQAEWNSLINYIQKAYKLGTKHSASTAYASDSNIRASDNHPVLEAAMYNEAYTRMKNLSKDNRETEYTPVSAGDIVYASTLNSLRTLANSFELHTYQCDTCNKCNDCETCNDCNTCQGKTPYCCDAD